MEFDLSKFTVAQLFIKALNPKTDPDILDLLAAHSNSLIREGVAQNPKTSHQTWVKLEEDSEESVRHMALLRDVNSVPPPYRYLLLEAHRKVLTTMSTSIEEVQDFSLNQIEPKYYPYIAVNPHMSLEVLKELSEVSPLLQEIVKENPNWKREDAMPDESLYPDPFTAQEAKESVLAHSAKQKAERDEILRDLLYTSYEHIREISSKGETSTGVNIPITRTDSKHNTYMLDTFISELERHGYRVNLIGKYEPINTGSDKLPYRVRVGISWECEDA